MKSSLVLCRIIIVCVFLLGILFVSLSLSLDEDYFSRVTSTKALSESALEKIFFFRVAAALLGCGLLLIGGVLFLKRQRLSEWLLLHPLAQSIVLFLMSATAVCLLLELGLRLAIPQEVKYNLGPGQYDFEQRFVHLNSEGFRDREHSKEKSEGIARIAILGDSFTMGWGIKNAEQTYPNLLEEKLNADAKKRGEGEKFEVINFGKRGVDTAYEKGVLEQTALSYDPDTVILGYVLNDFRDVSGEGGGREVGFYRFWADNFFKTHSYLYYFITQMAKAAQIKAGFVEPYEEQLLRQFRSEKNLNFNGELLSDINEISKNSNATFIVVVFPFIYHLDDYPFLHAHQFVKDTGDENGFLVIDLLEDYQRYSEEDLVVSRADSHPNELGHQLAAERIFQFMRNETAMIP